VIDLPPFAIARYPLTIAEWSCAVAAGAVKLPIDGGGQRKRDHTHFSAQPLGQAVTDISWQQANDYAQWLAALTGMPWRLPTEAEWEKAARGTDGRALPWGDEWDPQRVITTLTVGQCPAGASPYGVQDLVGTALQWTNSMYRTYPYASSTPPDGHDHVLHGAQWLSADYHSADDARDLMHVAQRRHARRGCLYESGIQSTRLALG